VTRRRNLCNCRRAPVMPAAPMAGRDRPVSVRGQIAACDCALRRPSTSSEAPLRSPTGELHRARLWSRRCAPIAIGQACRPAPETQTSARIHPYSPGVCRSPCPSKRRRAGSGHRTTLGRSRPRSDARPWSVGVSGVSPPSIRRPTIRRAHDA
jgi:hypothetical protein